MLETVSILRHERACGEERVALGVDLHPSVPCERFAEHPPALCQRLGVCLLTEFVKQLRRALEVGEQKGDGSGGEIAFLEVAVEPVFGRRSQVSYIGGS